MDGAVNQETLTGVDKNREVPSFICKVIRQNSTPFRYGGSENNSVTGIDLIVPVDIDNLNLTGGPLIHCRGFRLTFLPYPVKLVIVIDIDRLPDKPTITHFVCFITIEVYDFIPIDGHVDVGVPSESAVGSYIHG